MSNKGYAVLLVLAGMICGILIVSIASSPATAQLTAPERVVSRPEVGMLHTGNVPPVAAPSGIRVYPVGTGGKDDENTYAYVVKDGKLWHCEGIMAREVKFR